MAKIYKSLLTAAACLAAFPVCAQETENLKTINIYDEVIFFDGYNTLEGISDESKAMIPEDDGILRHRTSLYSVKLSEEQLSQIGEKLTMKVTIGALCDNYDRIGNINLAFVPKGAETYNPDEVRRIEIGRFITPFMNKNIEPSSVPYVYEMDNVSMILRDSKIRAEYDIWAEFELFGIPYAANTQVRGCADRQDVFTGTLDFITDAVPASLTDNEVLVPIVIKKPEYVGRNFNNYTEEGTDVPGKTDKTWSFDLPEDVSDGQIVLIISNHGANSGGEEYNRRLHMVYFDETKMKSFTPGRESCEPFRQYNTQPNGIYGSEPMSESTWQSFSNWCPGDKIDIRIFNVGAVGKGEHKFRIKVPLAWFADQQGDFPVSLYFQGVKNGTLSSIATVGPEFRSSVRVEGDRCLITSDVPARQAMLYDINGELLEIEFSPVAVSLEKWVSGVALLVIEYEDGLLEHHKLMK